VNDATEVLGSVENWSGKDRDAENFPVGVLIRPDLRPHVHAFYAFARNADDVADSGVLSPADKIFRLGVMESVLLGEREDGSPSAAGLRRSLAETGVGAVHARDLLRAFRQDAEKRRYASWDELIDYCRYSAMPVGRHVLALHGEDVSSWVPSDPLCAVLQVLNHLQDAAKDLRALDRCYLPADMLAEEGASVEDLRRTAETPGLRRVFGRMLDRCDAMNAAGAGLPGKVRDRRLRLETGIIVGLSRRLARRLRRGDPLATRVKLRPVDVVASALLSARHL
jgi:farnesyl-diphosphate farnesyltransferase